MMRGGINRRTLLIGGGAGVGLIAAWALWPRTFRPNLRAGDGEAILGGFLKIGSDGRVIVAVPQTELGQGVYTALPQILADELGADWNSVGVEPAPINPLYANRLLAGDASDGMLAGVTHWWRARHGDAAQMVTGGSTSVRAFEEPLREAGAAARALLAKAAARRWSVDWEQVDVRGGFALHGRQRLAIGALAEAAVEENLPATLPRRGGTQHRLTGRDVPRLDTPSKLDGSARFGADIRLPNMAYASVRAGPPGGRLQRIDRAAAKGMPGLIDIVERPHWVAAIAESWWAADRAVAALKPAFASGPLASDATVSATLDAGMKDMDAKIVAERGDVESIFAASAPLRLNYTAGPSANAPLETLCATARMTGDQLEVWAGTQAPELARRAAARGAGIGVGQVTLHRTPAGGGYGRKLEVTAIEQVAALAAKVKRPVQLIWSRIEEGMQDSLRPPIKAELAASMTPDGTISGWQAKIAVAPAWAETMARIAGDDAPGETADEQAVAGAFPPYGIPHVAILHRAVATGTRSGIPRGGADGYTAFFTESMIDELARKAGAEPLSFRMAMLGGMPRLAQCLNSAASLAGWDGGGQGSSMGLACHSAFGSHIALIVEAEVGADQRVRVSRAVAAVDCGRIVNPDIVRQQIEGGIMHGIAAATAAPVRIVNGLADMPGFAELGLPAGPPPEISVELIPSQDVPGGVTDLGVAPAAPAIANAIFAATGQRLRSLPLIPGTGA